MDLASPMETTSFDGKKYLLIIIDDYTRAIWVESLTLKSEVLTKVQGYIHQFEMGYGAQICRIMADNGREFVNAEMNQYLKNKGITLYTSVPYTYEQNGVAEQVIHTVTEVAHAMLYTSKLPKNLWSIAIKTMAYPCNWSPAWANEGMMPIERITGEKPNLAHLKVFGCPTSVAVSKEKRKKWDSRSQMGYMVGYKLYSMGYLIWYSSSHRVKKARDVIFHKEAITPAILTLYDDNDALRNVSK